MSTRNRVFIGILLIYICSVAYVLNRIIEDLDPRYRESAEESQVETAHLLASIIEQDLGAEERQLAILHGTFQSLYAKRFNAQIYSMNKTRVEMRVHVTDKAGRVIFDSLGRSEGQDYSQWRDVFLALAGQYGARTTRDVLDDPRTTVMYVSAPIRRGDEIIGTVSVGKPVQSFGQFVENARHQIIVAGIGAVLAFVLLALIVSVWLVRPFGFIADYVHYVKTQRPLSLRKLLRRGLGVLGAAWNEMRDALAGRHYVSEYVQALTHEIKSPLSAIRGAAELLQEPMAEAERAHFLANITRESGRIQALVDRLLELSSLEARRSLNEVARVDLSQLIADAVQAAQPAAQRRGVQFALTVPPGLNVEGDAFLLQRAVSNLIDNAIDFSPEGGVIDIELGVQRRKLALRIRDHGDGIPDYALDRVFEKFYSLARPHSGRKSSGLGLAFVREIAELHHGRVSLGNAVGGGAEARLELPRGAD
ncbi:two-component system sensor histidine kinase CreC [Uliginosibacterium flavum]|uniref:histidine kinase n=1 Tax=Uliginosibacterium flavum TaxID=1396831 RepID=A0ABV2TLX8_9RHOO